jgi:hypothetical protein
MLRNKSKVKGIKFENKVRKSIASGAVWFSPLDIQYDKYCIEAKYTDKKGYRVSLDLLEDIWDKALSMNKEPFLIIGIKRNEKQIFTLHCRINLEAKEGK